jgi:peptidoglycan-N-acetylglucosamine deacetylase
VTGRRAVRDGPRVALTFDAEHPDRPAHVSDGAERILDALADAGARATFFVQGRWALAEPGSAARIGADGHVVGNHSHHHARMPALTDAGIRADVLDAQAAVAEATGVVPRPWFRCPFGAGHRDPRVRAALADAGYRDVGWHLSMEDWEPWRTGADVAGDALAGIDAHGDGVVVLLHTWPASAVDAVPAILDGLAERGARAVGIDELPPEAIP